MKNKLQKCRFSNLKSITAKVFLMIAVVFCYQQLFAQFIDDFSDGDFVSNPTWSGNDSKFTIDSAQLSLKAPPASDIAYLATPSESINDATWEFLVRLDFNPSASNSTRIYVVSDQSDLSGSLNGYFVQVGNTTDDVSLYRQTGNSITRIIDGSDGETDALKIVSRIKVTREHNGVWTLYTSLAPGEPYVSEGTTVDLTHKNAKYFGVLCNYTATRSDKFSFDDFSIQGDENSDVLEPQSKPSTFKEIIITEIFADPLPSIGLPEVEFVEILNRGIDIINLNGWTLSDGSSTMKVTNVDITPGEYLIITSDPSFFVYNIKSIGSSDFPSLNNSDDDLILVDPLGNTIDSLHYTVDWYRNDQKKQGGWSLELIDPDNTCAEADNWTASEDPKGGTPSAQNSVNASHPDLTGPVLVSVVPVSPFTIRLLFNEKLQRESPLPSNFVIEPAIEVKSTSFLERSHKEILMELNNELSAGISYSMVINSLADCSGNSISDPSNQIFFGLPEDPGPGEIVINEILFNPRPAGVDFVEIVNASTKYFNLKNWMIGNFENDTLIHPQLISSTDLLLAPGGYLALTEDVDALLGDYLSACKASVFAVGDLPSLNDDAGSIAIASDDGHLLDSFKYSKDLHSVFINDPEGVSLERISFIVATNDTQNWKSGSTLSGYASPGCPNSNSRNGPVTLVNPIEVEPEVFVPFNGQPDFVLIHFEFDHGGYVANVNVLDASGHQVKQLANNEILGANGAFRWDGDNEDGVKARVGYYVVSFEVYDDTGDVRTFFNRVAVATRF